MFNKAAATEVPTMVGILPEPLIPLSVLSLDLDEPPIGWVTYLGNIGVEILTDGLGRSAIAHNDARRLFDEHREAEARKAELRAAAEKRSIEQDQAFRASLGHGVRVPDGMTMPRLRGRLNWTLFRISRGDGLWWRMRWTTVESCSIPSSAMERRRESLPDRKSSATFRT
jgi:hypothetical protein